MVPHKVLGQGQTPDLLQKDTCICPTSSSLNSHRSPPLLPPICGFPFTLQFDASSPLHLRCLHLVCIFSTTLSTLDCNRITGRLLYQAINSLTGLRWTGSRGLLSAVNTQAAYSVKTLSVNLVPRSCFRRGSTLTSASGPLPGVSQHRCPRISWVLPKDVGSDSEAWGPACNSALHF